MKSENHTRDSFDHFRSYTSRGRIFKLQSHFTQVPEVGAAFDYQYIAVVLFRAQNIFSNVKVFPGSDALADIVEMIMPAEEEVRAMRGVDGVIRLGRRRERQKIFGKSDVLWGNYQIYTGGCIGQCCSRSGLWINNQS